MPDEANPLSFTTHEEITSRPSWVGEIDAANHPLLRIIGDYSFPKNLEWKCGLKGCRTTHQKGFVIVTTDGLETHIGNICGANHFHVKWEELHSRFQKEKAEKAQRLYLEQSLTERDSLIVQSVKLLDRLQTQISSLQAVIDRIYRDRAVKGAFDEAVRLDGQIRKAVIVDNKEADDRDLTARERTRFESTGRLDGIAAVRFEVGNQGRDRQLLPGNRLIISLRQQITYALPRFTEERLSTANQKIRSEIAADLKLARETILESDKIAEATEKFLLPENLRQIGLLDVQRASNRAKKILAYFAGMAPNAGGSAGAVLQTAINPPPLDTAAESSSG